MICHDGFRCIRVLGRVVRCNMNELGYLCAASLESSGAALEVVCWCGSSGHSACLEKQITMYGVVSGM